MFLNLQSLLVEVSAAAEAATGRRYALSDIATTLFAASKKVDQAVSSSKRKPQFKAAKFKAFSCFPENAAEIEADDDGPLPFGDVRV